MKELSTKNYVVTTRNSGKYYVTKDQADKLVAMINSSNPIKIIEIDDNQRFATADFVNVLPAWKIEEISREKNGEWKCQSGTWHDRFGICKCGWGMDTSSTKTLIEDKQLTLEQKERGRLIRQLVSSREKTMNLRSKSNEELKKLLSDKIK